MAAVHASELGDLLALLGRVREEVYAASRVIETEGTRKAGRERARRMLHSALVPLRTAEIDIERIRARGVE